jgi:hypothetical protein
VEELGIAELTTKQIEILSQVVENSAKKHILSKISIRQVETLNIIVEANGEKPATIEVNVDLVLSPEVKDVNAEKLAKEAVREALITSESYLRKLK